MLGRCYIKQLPEVADPVSIFLVRGRVLHLSRQLVQLLIEVGNVTRRILNES